MSQLAITLPSKKYKQRATIFLASAIFVSVACIYMKFNPFGFFTEFHYMADLISDMFWPNYRVLSENTSITWSILLTVSMAYLGTLYGSVIGVILAFLAASNTMPYRAIRWLAGGILSATRIIPALVFILIFVIAVGPGPFAGMLTMVIATVGNFGKLFTEIIEDAENAPGEAIFSVGASRVQVIRFSIIPQILPSLIANVLYGFDVNIRTVIAIGIFGGGGIGFEFQMAKSVLHYKDMAAVISIMIVLIFLSEKLSNYLRKKILGEDKLR
jgi:phosphonate transport system permease protein